MTTVGVISDTHVSSGGKRVLARQVFEIFDGVDMILHAGDLNCLQVLHDLEAIAPVFGVYGNNCDFEVVNTLPPSRLLTIESLTLGITHGDRGAGYDTAAIALSHFPTADCVIFGHSHWPLIQWKLRSDGKAVLLFNPGSAGQKRKAPHFSCGILKCHENEIEPQLYTWD